MDLTVFFAYQSFCSPFSTWAITGASALNSNATVSCATSHISEINHFINPLLIAAYCAHSGAGH